MARRIKYHVEKILYLADQEKPLNVSVSEKPDTDLNERVATLLRYGHLEYIGSDDVDHYYKITTKGKVKLLRMQIETRKGLGKPVDRHELELEELLNNPLSSLGLPPQDSEE